MTASPTSCTCYGSRVISAPVVGGALGLTVRGTHPAEHRLEALAVEDVSPPKTLRAGLCPWRRALQVQHLGVDSPRPLGLSLDGELDGNLPGQFEAVAGALRVIVPRRF